ncbi:hypothetical protein IWX49DRAFT_625756 [Phyllosticta citricarpa]|uniref:Uncharacterized protein n=2 Tax=Phyllosticta TaxID=121621 RepID=A0ABR1MP69_9PEZI
MPATTVSAAAIATLQHLNMSTVGAASTMRTVTLSLLTHTPLLPSSSLFHPTEAFRLPAALSTPAMPIAATTAAAPDQQDFDMGSLPWPPLWLTIFAFALTLVAAVVGAGAWLISSPPRYDECVCEDEYGRNGDEEEEVREERAQWERKGEDEEVSGEWESEDEDEDEDGYEDGAVELKRLLSDAPRQQRQQLDDKQHTSNTNTTAVNRRNFRNLRLDLPAAAGLGVGSWGRGDAGYDCVDGDDVWETKCRDYGVDGRHHGDDDDDDTASLFSLSLASCSSPSASSAHTRLNVNDTTSKSRKSVTSVSAKPIFSHPLRGWRKAVDDRVGVLACWIEAYVADGGREKDLLCKVTREERGEVVYGFEY